MDKRSPEYRDSFPCMCLNSYRTDDEAVDNETLARRLQDGDGTAAALLLSNNEKLLNACALDLCDRYGMTAITDDLKQEGALALLDAARRYHFDTQAKFLTYAYPAVRAAMLDAAAAASLPVSLPPSRYHRVRNAAYLIAAAQPSTRDDTLIGTIQTQMGVSPKVARSLLQDAHAMLGGVQLGDGVFQISCGGDPAARYAAGLRRRHIDELLKTLTPRERTVIRKYCGFDDPDGIGMGFEELAARLNYNSPSAAEKAFKKAAAKLRAEYGTVGRYGVWREAEAAFLAAQRESEQPELYSTPQDTWYGRQER